MKKENPFCAPYELNNTGEPPPEIWNSPNTGTNVMYGGVLNNTSAVAYNSPALDMLKDINEYTSELALAILHINSEKRIASELLKLTPIQSVELIEECLERDPTCWRYVKSTDNGVVTLLDAARLLEY